MIKKILPFLTILICSCSSPDQPEKTEANGPEKTTAPPQVKELQIAPASAGGWGGDIRLGIINKTATDSAEIYTAGAMYKGRELGLTVSIPKKKGDGSGFGSGLILSSSGAASDYLLYTLSGLYKQKADSTQHFVKSVTLTYVDLDAMAASMGARENKEYKVQNQYKLFYEGSNENEYAEIYLNINEAEHWLELNEKDEEYRPVIIQMLREKKK